MNKRRSILILLVLSFLFTYVGISFYSVYKGSDEFYDDYIDRKVVHMLTYMKLGRAMIEADQLDGFVDLLKEGNDTYLFDYFGVYWQDDLVHHGKEAPDSPFMVLPKERDEVIVTDNQVFAATDMNGYTIYMGVKRGRAYYMASLLDSEKDEIIKDIIIVMLAFFLITSFFLRDILEIIQTIRSRGDKSLKGFKGKSVEAQVLAESFSGYQKKQKQLQDENLLLSHQLLPALRSELLSGKEPPYVFECTLVRTDINGFSDIFSQYPVETFMEWIDKFFVETTEIVSRYKGFVAEFVGDEVIFYFKDEDHENSVMIAMHALTEINKRAERIHKETLKQHGFPFMVKSSLAHGKLRFGKQVDGYNLAGSIFIETVRILSHITEKDENTVYLSHRSKKFVDPEVETSSQGMVSLKGFVNPVELIKVNSVAKLEPALDQLVYSNSQNIQYFRTPEDIVTVFDTICEQKIYKNMEAMSVATMLWREFPYVKSTKELSESYFKLLRKLKAEVAETNSEPSLKVLSTFISLAAVFLDREQITTEQGQELSNFIAVNHPRLSANAVEVLGRLKVPFSKSEAKTLLAFPHNRVVANSLVRMGREEISRQVVKGLEELLTHKDAVYRSSGLFALGEIQSHYQKEDPIYLRSQGEFRKLFSRTVDGLSSENEMIVRQSYLAILKSGDSGLKTVVNERLKAQRHPLLNEVAGMLTPKWDAA